MTPGGRAGARTGPDGGVARGRAPRVVVVASAPKGLAEAIVPVLVVGAAVAPSAGSTVARRVRVPEYPRLRRRGTGGGPAFRTTAVSAGGRRC